MKLYGFHHLKLQVTYMYTARFSEAPWQATPEDDAYATAVDDIRSRAFASCLGQQTAINPTQQRLLVAGLTKTKRKTPKAKAKAKTKE